MASKKLNPIEGIRRLGGSVIENQAKTALIIAGAATAACIGIGFYVDDNWTSAEADAAKSVANSQPTTSDQRTSCLNQDTPESPLALSQRANREHDAAGLGVLVGGTVFILDLSAAGVCIGAAVSGK